jgi:hypothetical protein
MPDVAGFLFDDENEEEMAAHGLTPRRVIQVLENKHIVVPNRRERRARNRAVPARDRKAG